MARTTGGQVGSIGADNLIAGIYPPPVTQVFDLKTSGIIERGTVLGRGADGKYFVLGAKTGTGTSATAIEGTASVIVAETTEEDDEIVVAYISGHFYRNGLIVADDYELTEADENNLRLAGIRLTDGI